MNSRVRLIVNIICLRERLNELIMYKGSLQDTDIIHTSQILDNVLNDYHKEITKYKNLYVGYNNVI